VRDLYCKYLLLRNYAQAPPLIQIGPERLTITSECTIKVWFSNTPFLVGYDANARKTSNGQLLLVCLRKLASKVS